MARDHVDDLLDRLEEAGAPLDLEVEGIVDRIGGIHKRMRGALKETLGEYGLTPEDWSVLCSLHLRGPDATTSPGALARDLEISSGAMTSRLDRLETAGYIRRVADPSDRRAVVVGITDEGRQAWDEAAEVQGRKEAFFASALSKTEQKQLNTLLRKLVLAFDARASSRQPAAAD
jgi:DNA-binding MarR family transcriptional regulator